MKILAFEFSSSQRSVAVLNADESGVTSTGEVVESSPGNSTQPLSMVERALNQAGLERGQIECIAVGIGPGSYTSIRVAISLAQGWQLATNVKLTGVSSVECIAEQAVAEGLNRPLSVVVDAQRGEFYLAGYDCPGGKLREVVPLRIVSSDEVRAREQAGDVLVGPDVTRWFPGGRQVFPRAEVVATLALAWRNFVSGKTIEPIYLRETQFVKAAPPRVI
ncbi:MAG: tRNA (adenosine(37)-N6)-threonylcarbamoyltransferase complex dimerization subunit type 1 TsaB [Verrucomicrobia bacterium]|nr:tRNA (adenosine(37)-N6)-threonylcarbamoyltransferase complex dimerization subunit type 1 TsaB [Verrucomicrobiota bacterium]